MSQPFSHTPCLQQHATQQHTHLVKGPQRLCVCPKQNQSCGGVIVLFTHTIHTQIQATLCATKESEQTSSHANKTHPSDKRQTIDPPEGKVNVDPPCLASFQPLTSTKQGSRHANKTLYNAPDDKTINPPEGKVNVGPPCLGSFQPLTSTESPATPGDRS
jgi:hypothetical protein